MSDFDIKFRNRTPDIVALEQQLDWNQLLIEQAKWRITHCNFKLNHDQTNDDMKSFYDNIICADNDNIKYLSNERKVLQLKLKAANIKAGNST